MASRQANSDWTVERLGSDDERVKVEIGPHPEFSTCVLLTHDGRTIEVPVDDDNVARPHDPLPEWAYKPLRQLGVRA